MLDKVKRAADYIRSSGIDNPQVGIVLGTGLGKLADRLEPLCIIDYKDIPGFPVSTVESHSGKLIYGRLQGKNVLAMQGRFHYYEGYSLQDVTFPIRVFRMLGISYLLLSNAAGAMNLKYKKGSLMLITDHINMLPDNPLRGNHSESFGPRFPDMSCPYSPHLNQKMVDIALREQIVLHQGVYISVMGPNLETRAEYRMFRTFADAVGMSTVPEVIVAHQMGLPCAAVSVLTDECDPDNLVPTKLEDILQAAATAETDLVKLFSCLIGEMEL
ncbi:MAG: purine-nucleoside phosphorylase [Bacteroidales bacterium]|nr:purine-nucleoside phosphorylase [Bacteroidales bacterium]